MKKPASPRPRAALASPDAGPAEPKRGVSTVRTRRLVLVDDEGRERAVLGLNPNAGNEPSLEFRDRAGQSVLTVGLVLDMGHTLAQVAFGDRMDLTVDGDDGETSISMYDSEGRVGWHATDSTCESRRFSVKGSDGRIHTELSCVNPPEEPDSPYLVMTDREGRALLNIGLVEPDNGAPWNPYILLSDSRERDRVRLAVEDGQPVIRTHNADRSTAWQAPSAKESTDIQQPGNPPASSFADAEHLGFWRAHNAMSDRQSSAGSLVDSRLLLEAIDRIQSEAEDLAHQAAVWAGFVGIPDSLAPTVDALLRLLPEPNPTTERHPLACLRDEVEHRVAGLGRLVGGGATAQDGGVS